MLENTRTICFETGTFGRRQASGGSDLHLSWRKSRKSSAGPRDGEVLFPQHCCSKESHRQLGSRKRNSCIARIVRRAFSSASDLFVDIGNKSYDFWGRFLPMTRLAEATDYFVVSGWESTAIENHSGNVDNQRDFKGDPSRFRRNNERLQPVIEPHGLVHRTGEAVFSIIGGIDESTEVEVQGSLF
jgi:hypothetical protein